MAMQVEGSDEGGEQQPALGRDGVHRMKIAARSIRDHEGSGLNRTLDGVHELGLGIDRAEVPRFAAKRIEIEQQAETRASPRVRAAGCDVRPRQRQDQTDRPATPPIDRPRWSVGGTARAARISSTCAPITLRITGQACDAGAMPPRHG